MEMLSAADDSSGANPSSVKSDDSSPRHESGRGSPPPKCAICLGTCRNKSFTDSCLHQFCFKCLLTWSKVKAECPLCKQNFKSIIHNVRSNHQYDEYTVEQRHEEPVQSLDIDNLTNATRRFRYRTTLTLPRRETLAIQQLLMQHYPLMADVFPQPSLRAPVARRRRSPTTFRRTVYRHNLWARPLPDFTGRFRDCTPEFYRYNDSQMHRLVPWINRELHYLLNENIGHISYVMSRILELLPRYHINSSEFREAMQRYFGDRTEHFLHELYCFASTPYDMTGYDRNVQYTTNPPRISTMVNEVISSSESEASVDSDIVMVSSSHPAELPLPPAPPPLGPGPSRLPAPVYPQHYIPQPPTVDNVIPIETISHSDTDDDDEVMVVGYIKPPQDRTPEVVDLLGSDSDVIVQDSIPEPREEQPARPVPLVPLVRLSLKRHMTRDAQSDSEDSYRPPAPRRRRRARSRATATTSDTTRTTPSPSHSPLRSPSLLLSPSFLLSPLTSPAPDYPSTTYYTPSASPSPRTTRSISASPSPPASNSTRTSRSISASPSPRTSRSISAFSDSSLFAASSASSYSSYGRKKKLTKKKSKRKTRTKSAAAERDRKKKRSSRSRHKERSSAKADARNKRKSHSGKGVKSSRKANEAAAARPEPSQTPPLWPPDGAQPSTSGAPPPPPPRPAPASEPHEPRPRLRPHSHESRRLRSVVNVMFKNSGDSSPGNSTPTYGVAAPSGVVSQANGEERTKTEDRTVPPVGEELEYPALTRYSDTEDSDDLPLNLSVQKTYINL